MPDTKMRCGSIEWKFKCTKQWEGLEKTSDDKIRWCNDCDKPVHFVDSIEDLARAQVSHQCVAYSLDRTDYSVFDGPTHMVGLPCENLYSTDPKVELKRVRKPRVIASDRQKKKEDDG